MWKRHWSGWIFPAQLALVLSVCQDVTDWAWCLCRKPGMSWMDGALRMPDAALALFQECLLRSAYWLLQPMLQGLTRLPPALGPCSDLPGITEPSSSFLLSLYQPSTRALSF